MLCRTHLPVPMHAGHEIRMLTALICLTSTDFSRQDPINHIITSMLVGSS